MQVITKRRCLHVSIIGLLLFVAEVSAGVTQNLRSADFREFSEIRDDWERVVLGFALEGRVDPGESPPKPVPPLTGKEKAAAEQRLAGRCLKLAEKYPNTVGELAALYLAASRGSELELGKKAQKKLIARIESADLAQLQQAIRYSRVRGGQAKDAIPRIASGIISRLKKNPEQPSAAALLTYICASLGSGSETKEPPPHFTEAADLIVARYATSSDIYNFCECLGGMNFSPHWATTFESHLRTILKVNKHRWVRSTASLALASVVQLSTRRQVEAEKLYEKFLADFDGQYKYHAQNVEKVIRERAKQRLLAMKFAPIGKPAPEIDGVDLDGKSMKLSEYRGKVVLMSYWATWCFPCMKFIPHERELATRFEDKPFAIVGVNADKQALTPADKQAFTQVVKKYKITWRSFRDKRPGKKSISDEWNALYPTVYLIDHKGIIRKRWTGTPPPEVLSRMVDELVEAAQAK